MILINRSSSHAFDFENTHFKSIIGSAGPVASATAPLAGALTIDHGAPSSDRTGLIIKHLIENRDDTHERS